MNIVEALENKNLTIATAESLTAGLIASNICSISGASNYFKGGIVAYTKEIKCNLLGLKMENIDKYGVYSKETVISMADGIIAKTKANLAITTSGVAGPSSDEGVEAGTVYICYAIFDKRIAECIHFSGSRNEVRSKVASYAIDKMISLIEEI